MKMGKIAFSLLLTLLMGSGMFSVPTTHAADAVTLYTTYTNISVAPGESVNYSIDVINNTSEVQDVQLSVENGNKGWDTQLTSGGWTIHQISVKPNDSRSVSLDVNVPLEVNKGDYKLYVNTNGERKLELSINVSEQGTYKTELTTDQPNMEGHSDASFNFSTTLKNRTADKQNYALTYDAPRGWDVQFNAGGKSVTSVSVDANSSSSVNVTIQPPQKVAAGTYKIPVKAAAGSTSAETQFEVVITGTYGISLSTPNGLLSADITAGKEKNVELQVTNNGSVDLKDINLSASAPVNWEVSFDPKKIEKLEPGKSQTVTATIKADSKAISGDYVTSMTAGTPEASSDAQFRISVKTSMLWGWIGILIILAVVVLIYYLFRTYGRR